MDTGRLRNAILGMLFLSTAINYIDRQALSVLVPVLRQDLGLSSADYGLITTLFMVAYTAAQIFAGAFIDRAGTRLGFVASIAIWSGAAVAHVFASGAVSLAILRFMLGLGEAGNWPAGAKAVAEWFPKSKRAFAMGLFDGGSALGAILAPPMVAALALYFGWRAAFVTTGTLGFLWLAAWLWIYRAPEQRTTLPVNSVAAIRRLLGVRQLWGLMATRMIATPVWWFYVFWLPDYLGKDRAFSLKEIGMFAWIPFLTVDLGKLLGGALSDRLLRRGASATWARKSVMAGGALAMLGGIQVVGSESAALAMTWVCLATFGFGMWSSNILALHADIFPADSMATAVGITGTAASLGGAIFTYCTGLIVDRAGYGPVFWVAGLAALVAFICLVFLVGRVQPVEYDHAIAQ